MKAICQWYSIINTARFYTVSRSQVTASLVIMGEFIRLFNIIQSEIFCNATFSMLVLTKISLWFRQALDKKGKTSTCMNQSSLSREDSSSGVGCLINRWLIIIKWRRGFSSLCHLTFWCEELTKLLSNLKFFLSLSKYLSSNNKY